jgi:UDP-N-acetylglucosamine acyltransferase
MSIHPTAIVDSRAEIDPSAVLGPHVVIDGPAKIGPNCQLGPFAVVLGNTQIGARCRIHSHAVIGDVPQDRAFEGGESFCQIGDDCIIREGVTIHRGTEAGTATVIANRCQLMTNAHVGHNCYVADDAILISGCLLGGYVYIGSRAIISGNAAVHQFVRVGELAMVSGLGKIVQDVPPFFMTDRNGKIVGVNYVGLMRAGISAAERREIRDVFRDIYHAGMGHAQVIEHLSSRIVTDAGKRLLEFIAADSHRGIAADSARSRKAA